MAVTPMNKLIWKMGLPMIVSMILQAVYNIVDTAFVINMGEEGTSGNLALAYAFPIQLLIIAVGVGTGVGINALLSKSLGERNKKKVDKIAGNGIFLGICIYIVFLLFGIFGVRGFIALQASNNALVADMGTEYLTICCCFSFGSIGFTIYERFLQSTGKTMYSTIAQISGALTNIVLDYVSIYPLQMGVAGAAWATVIGQILSLIVAMLFHYLTNKEIGNGLKNILPSGKIIKGIYHIGISATIMQGLLSVMMLGVNLILGTVGEFSELLQGSFGIYYKIMQFALFACFGLSNTIISILSFNFGMRDKKRVKSCIFWGITDSLIVSLIVTVLFEVFASPLAGIFGMANGETGSEITAVVITAIRIAAIGYVFMGVSLAVQGILQALRYALAPLLISALRLAVLILPAVWLFSLSDDPLHSMWWAFPVVEAITFAVSLILFKRAYDKDVKTMND